MPRLSNLRPALSGIVQWTGGAPKTEADRDKHRRLTQPSKTWLKSAWWLKARQRVLTRDRHICRRCKVMVCGKGEAFVDHIKPHRENRDLFFCGDTGLQTLCKTCHSSVKQREEQQDIKGVWY